MVAPDRDIAQAAGFIAPPGYSRHRPETTLLYQLVAEHYLRFRDRRAAEGRALPQYVEDEFEAYLKCGLLEHGFLKRTDARLASRYCWRTASFGSRHCISTNRLPVILAFLIAFNACGRPHTHAKEPEHYANITKPLPREC